MSPPPDQPGARARTYTRPPAPPSTIEDRVRDLEHGVGTLEREIGDLVSESRKTNDTLTGIATTLTTINTEREAEKARSKFWMKALVGVLATLAGALILWLAKIAMIVQSARLP